jgi:tRNA1Val (adenine37-N6)-methyltransferase
LLTSDTLFDGRLIVNQEREGYRFSLDALLLAGLTKAKPHDVVIDLGTGSGVVLLVLAFLDMGRKLVGLEIQPELALLAQKNVELNGFSDRIEVMREDLRRVGKLFSAGQFDLVVSNPPYRRLGTGRINPQPQRAAARHELTASVSDVFAAGRHLLSPGGRLTVIYPSTRLDHLLLSARDYGFSPRELTVIHSTGVSPARLVHLECRKGGGEELRIAPPFCIYQEDGSYTEAMRRIFGKQD